VNELLNTLYAQTPGTSLHLDGDTVRIYHPEQAGRRLLPLARIDHLVLFGGVTATDDLLLRCADEGRSVSWLTTNGRFRARLTGPTRGNVLLRRAQHRTADDSQHRQTIARALVAGKAHNTRQVLLRAARDATAERQSTLRGSAQNIAEEMIQIPNADSADTLLGIEGTIAREYFSCLPLLLTNKMSKQFTTRERRPPTDPVNCLLSFLYGLLRVAVQGATEQVGLDPYVGFLHATRPGKPALALDLMEEFRPLLADRLAVTLFNRGEVNDTHFEHLPGGAVRLTEDGRKLVLGAWQRSRERTWPHGFLGREVPGALLPLVQARMLGRHLRGDLDTYVPWTIT
jgi:CRISPR-associated endonuclease Cas1